MGFGTTPIDYENELKQRDETIARLTARLQQLEAEIEELKKLLAGKAESKTAKKPRFTENYSLDRINHKPRRHKDSTGRRGHETKQDAIEDQHRIYWPDADPDACICHRQQCAWRIVDGKAVYVCYSLYDVPGSKQLPLPPGLRTSRSEFGIEIILVLAFLHYWIGVSIDHARAILQFFTGLDLSKSQADSLLSQLAADWDEQYETITELIALSMIVYIDETAWKVGKHACYSWAFSTALYVLFRCGVGRGRGEAEEVLGTFFAGIGVTDDYATYKNLFSQHQLCWAHLLRKAIKLALQNPQDRQYAQFLDELCLIYRQAGRYRHDRRLTVGRREKVGQLQERIRSLCTRYGEPIDKDTTTDPEATFIRLQNEFVDNLPCLFVFVEHPEVEPTNNRSERNVRREAEIRKGGRTSKTPAGAKRRGVIMTVLASLRTRFPRFTLANLLSEVGQWLAEGRSVFESELADLQKVNGPPTGEPAILLSP
jgi:hypothetical protein